MSFVPSGNLLIRVDVRPVSFEVYPARDNGKEHRDPYQYLRDKEYRAAVADKAFYTHYSDYRDHCECGLEFAPNTRGYYHSLVRRDHAQA